jgi:hypothetical protein
MILEQLTAEKVVDLRPTYLTTEAFPWCTILHWFSSAVIGSGANVGYFLSASSCWSSSDEFVASSRRCLERFLTLPAGVAHDVHARRHSTQTTAIQEYFAYGTAGSPRAWWDICVLIEYGADVFEVWPTTPSSATVAFTSSRLQFPMDPIEEVLAQTRNPASVHGKAIRRSCQIAKTKIACVLSEERQQEHTHMLMHIAPLVELILSYNHL